MEICWKSHLLLLTGLAGLLPHHAAVLGQLALSQHL